MIYSYFFNSIIMTRLIDIIILKPDKNWDWQALSLSPHITWDDVDNNKNLKWDKEKLIQNPNITWKEIKANVEYFDKYLEYFAGNSNITPNIIVKNNAIKWDLSLLSSNRAIQLSFIEYNKNINWDWKEISKNPNLTFNFIMKNMTKNFCWKSISKHQCIVWDTIKNTPTLQWDWDYISINPNITFDIISNNLKYAWNMSMVSMNPNITLDIVKENPNYKWDLEKLIINENITFDMIKESKMINYISNYSANPNLTPSIISDNMIAWDYKMISSNIMDMPYKTKAEFKIKKQSILDFMKEINTNPQIHKCIIPVCRMCQTNTNKSYVDVIADNSLKREYMIFRI